MPTYLNSNFTLTNDRSMPYTPTKKDKEFLPTIKSKNKIYPDDGRFATIEEVQNFKDKLDECLVGKTIRTITNDANGCIMFIVTSLGEVYLLRQESPLTPKRFLKKNGMGKRRNHPYEVQGELKNLIKKEVVGTGFDTSLLIKDDVRGVQYSIVIGCTEKEEDAVKITFTNGLDRLSFSYVGLLDGRLTEDCEVDQNLLTSTGFNCPGCAACIHDQQLYCNYCKSMLQWQIAV